ncbi:P-loop containing nucleoside triphosphate hydrolase protein [Zopfochytrium polystomum]|nr:P-loop containing nucleoside triphosphate hydrolase protein [Zopfochytrium polystomum]
MSQYKRAAGGGQYAGMSERKKLKIKQENSELYDEGIKQEMMTVDAKMERPEDEHPAEIVPIVREREVIIPKKASMLVIPGEPNREGIIRDLATQFFEPPSGTDYSFQSLKPDAHTRPLWVADDGKILLEAFSPLAAPAQDFLITIAEPVSRPARVHEYRLTTYSLYAAVSVGMETNILLEVLERYSKVKLPERVIRFIKDCTLSYGKVKLVLKHNRYFLESSYPEILRLLLKDQVISEARLVRQDDNMNGSTSLLSKPKSLLPSAQGASRAAPTEANIAAATTPANAALDDTAFGAVIFLDQADDDADADGEADFAQSFEIEKARVEDVKKRCTELDYPLMEEYDFRHDDVNPNLDIDLSPRCMIRDYQEKSLSKMFGGGGGRARSGIIVLPTGAGKTLVGITAACTVKKSTLVLCTNAISVEQWANEFRHWSTISEDRIAKFTSQSKAKFAGESGIVVSTYTMITHSGTRSWETGKMIEFINSREWGLLILDEVHVVPANVFRRVLTTVAAHTKLGLTATLVREDEKIADLNFLIGPKLYEANWMDLAGRGHIAKVEATEIWCPMTGDFYHHYMRLSPRKRRLLCVMNPIKFMVAQYLIRTREAAGDKIIVFSDNVYALRHYAHKMKKPFIYGKTQEKERMSILNYFRNGHPSFQTIFLSKVGDTSLDLPEATCLIQISSQFGSRRQEAQRMGRILRAKRRNEEGFRSRFFTLVSQDTDEVAFSDKRKRFLIDQGYQYKVISSIKDLIPEEEMSELAYYSKKDQADLLNMLLKAEENAGDEEEIEAREDDLGFTGASSTDKGKGRGKRPAGEKAKQLALEKKRNPLFRKFYKKNV